MREETQVCEDITYLVISVVYGTMSKRCINDLTRFINKLEEVSAQRGNCKPERIDRVELWGVKPHLAHTPLLSLAIQLSRVGLGVRHVRPFYLPAKGKFDALVP